MQQGEHGLFSSDHYTAGISFPQTCTPGVQLVFPLEHLTVQPAAVRGSDLFFVSRFPLDQGLSAVCILFPAASYKPSSWSKDKHEEENKCFQQYDGRSGGDVDVEGQQKPEDC